MQIKIKNNEYNLNFGVRFVRELDKVAGVTLNQNGVKQSFGMGVTRNIIPLRQYDPATLATVLKCATWDNVKRPNQKEIDDFIDNPETDLEKLFDDVLAEMDQANAIKVVTKQRLPG